ncbi:hypothetical protein LPJ61_001808 [Coemansia biformis]|uniref:Velvet domain-containing protein n=1 Tax=Coemansia biformis TaxID=1286918 RepID=A0A9W7YFP6_9FUNG|nr:hypothetical protein LPJ61_001808 [Coemansia biformis]
MDRRYKGVVRSPDCGAVGEPLAPVTVSLELLDPDGVPLALDDRHASGIVVNVGLASEDGTLDLGYAETGTLLLSGTLNRTPEVLDDRLVTTFPSLAVHWPGRYRLCARVFNILHTVAHIPTHPGGPLPAPSDALYVGYSDVLAIRDGPSRDHPACAPPPATATRPFSSG